MKDVKKIFGIDSLYYFCETNEDYDDLFLDILDQIEETKGKFEKREIEYINSDIHIKLQDISLYFLGFAEGFYWFRDVNDYFKIGFKDKMKNRGLNDIRVQLQGNGIYTIGIHGLLQVINEHLLDGYISDYIPITRADINCFVQYDLGFISKDMFSTRKRKYSTINEIGSAKALQTIYIGKEPFKLRIYNKTLELKNSKKKALMYEYFANNGFNQEDIVFNVEFQLHRTYLKQFNIQTVQELIANANNLFKQCMDEVRLLEEPVSESSIAHNNKHRKNTHPLWESIKEEFDLKDYFQSSIPLTRLKRKLSMYDEDKFKDEFIFLIRKGVSNNVPLDLELVTHYYKEAKHNIIKTHHNLKEKKRYVEVQIIHPNNKIEKLRLLEDGRLIKPLNIETVSRLQDYDLLLYYEKLLEIDDTAIEHQHKIQIALKELQKRNLIPQVKPHEANEKEEGEDGSLL